MWNSVNNQMVSSDVCLIYAFVIELDELMQYYDSVNSKYPKNVPWAYVMIPMVYPRESM